MASDATLTYRDVRITVLDGLYLIDGRPTEEAVKYYQDVCEHLNDFRQFAAENLLDLYNDVWSDEDEPMDQETFKTKLVNPAIVLYDEVDRANVYFEDSDLFWGHGIEIRLEGTTPRHANLVG